MGGSMTPADRNLLAAAARAAGKSRAEWDYDWLVERGVDVSRDMLWNPLENMGEAAELAVTLRIEPTFSKDGKYVFSGYEHVKPKYGRPYSSPINEPIEPGLYAAWRRAVVRRAAAIAPPP